MADQKLSFPNAIMTRINLAFDELTKHKVEKLQEQWRATSASEAMRRAVDIAFLLKTYQLQGFELVIRDGNRTIKVLPL